MPSSSYPSPVPARSPSQPKRVLSRRGSLSAPDPWGSHTELNMNPARSTYSKLTIVRVNDAPPPLQLADAPPSPSHRRHFGFGHAHHGLAHGNHHRRHGSNGSVASSGRPESPRMSFASASFAAPGSPTGSGSRPNSPTHHRASSSSFSKPRLTPDQLVALAQQSCSPRAPPTPASSPYSPGNAHPTAGSSTTRATFTALPEDVYLPFIDRAAEVNTLFSGPPSARLLTLLSQTFAGSPTSSPQVGAKSDDVFDSDPQNWSYVQLEYWLKHVDRECAPDAVWVARARRCILVHSELIWERIKGALGVPPELDFDDGDDQETANSALYPEFDTGAVSAPAKPPAGLVSEQLVGLLSPEVSATDQDPLEAVDSHSMYSVSSDISIEHVIATSSQTPPEHPPTRPGAHRMMEISEDVDEEGEPAVGLSASKTSDSLAPPQDMVQGLRISTSPASPALFAASPMARPFTPFSPTMDKISPLPEEQISTSASIDAWRRRSDSVGSHRYAASTTSSDIPYDAVGERGPGNPLFPSSFARLALGPTLSANNPALRRPSLPPPPVFGNPHTIRGRRAAPSWADGFDLGRHEYAVTASEGSLSAIGVGA